MISHDIIEEMLGDIQPDERNKLFYRVACIKMAAPRHERFEFIMEMGRININKVFNGSEFDYGELTFVFPERWMSVHEQQKFTWILDKHPHASTIQRVDIVTSSPLVIGSFHRENIRICTWPDDHLHDGNEKW